MDHCLPVEGRSSMRDSEHRAKSTGKCKANYPPYNALSLSILDAGRECTLNKYAVNTELGGVVDAQHSCAVIQRDPGKLEKQADEQRAQGHPQQVSNDTKPSDAVVMLEGRGVTQRDLEREKRLAHVNLMKSSMAKCKVLHVFLGKSKHKCRFGGEWIENSPEERDLGVLLDEKSSVSQPCVLVTGLIPQCGQQGREGFCPSASLR
ncbi:hypothetical protein DUI87_31274 [Hirundo rustica rustica]|uniref:Uncharacterized protein n=1 Tax=Hirundo rustica rustica TaxID=333673 RepID=A0A3M0IZH9_HIRRU|nr:hypothetical protein DUI87_31274 [Hirundo rustica rustica]